MEFWKKCKEPEKQFTNIHEAIETPDGTVKGRNVGKTKADGSPVTREQKALEDLNGAGIETDFTPYDR